MTVFSSVSKKSCNDNSLFIEDLWGWYCKKSIIGQEPVSIIYCTRPVSNSPHYTKKPHFDIKCVETNLYTFRYWLVSESIQIFFIILSKLFTPKLTTKSLLQLCFYYSDWSVISFVAFFLVKKYKLDHSSLGNRFGEGSSHMTPILDQDQPGPSYQNVRDEFLVESESDEEDVFDMNGNESSDDDDENGMEYEAVRVRKDRLVHNLETCLDASNYNRYS